MSKFVLATITLGLILSSGCQKQSDGFALPEGDPKAGKASFILLNCNHCHSIVDKIDKAEDGHPDIHYKIGGEVTRVHTYGDLVTSIINPSHRILQKEKYADAEGESKMRQYNEFMTITELINLTTFLQQSYTLVPPPNTVYYVHPAI